MKTEGNRIDRFLAERAHRWDELAAMLERVEAGDSMSADRLREMLGCYRQCCSDLNRARLLTADPHIVGRLDHLCSRAYRYIHAAPRQPWSWQRLADFYWQTIPAAMRRARRELAVAALCMLLGAVIGAVGVAVDRDLGRAMIPPQFFTESPKERVAGIEENEERIENLESASTFSASLFTHNIQVTFLAFGLGALSIVGGWWLLSYNGMILGAVATMYVQDGVTLFFLAWVGPHGVIELPAIIVGAAAGLYAGRAIFGPGEKGRRRAVRERLPTVWALIAAAASMLVVAGLIEGSLSQFSNKTVPYGIKIGFAMIAALMVGSYLAGLTGRRDDEPEARP